VQERIKFLLLMLIEALFLLLLISRKLLQVTTLLHIQSVVLLLLMGTEGCPVLLPPRVPGELLFSPKQSAGMPVAHFA
jgi:hypothetical protein